MIKNKKTGEERKNIKDTNQSPDAMRRVIYYPPIILPFLILLIIFTFIFFSLFATAVNAVFVALGIPAWVAYLLLILSFVGSFVNIPIKEIYNETEYVKPPRSFYGTLYPVNILEPTIRKTTISINLGGAIIPLVISVYILIKNFHAWPAFLLSAVVVIAICHTFARVVPGLGIAMPNFIPPISACLLSLFSTLLFGCVAAAPFVAYLSGVMGTLVGADLLNLNKISKLNARMISIGGAGSFDGIFITGIFSVLLTLLIL